MANRTEVGSLVEVEDPIINWVQKLILFGVKILAILMAVVVLWTVVDVTFIIYYKASQPPYLLADLDDILSVFGSFLVALIAIEIFINIVLYLRKDTIHLRLVLATALMAIARKVIILDYESASSTQLYAIAAIIAALGLAYWLSHKPHLESSNQKIPS